MRNDLQEILKEKAIIFLKKLLQNYFKRLLAKKK